MKTTYYINDLKSFGNTHTLYKFVIDKYDDKFGFLYNFKTAEWLESIHKERSNINDTFREISESDAFLEMI